MEVGWPSTHVSRPASRLPRAFSSRRGSALGGSGRSTRCVIKFRARPKYSSFLVTRTRTRRGSDARRRTGAGRRATSGQSEDGSASAFSTPPTRPTARKRYVDRQTNYAVMRVPLVRASHCWTRACARSQGKWDQTPRTSPERASYTVGSITRGQYPLSGSVARRVRRGRQP